MGSPPPHFISGADIQSLPVLATGSPAPRRLSDRFASYFDVRDFGALGDGATDDSAAINAAVAFVGARSIGGTIEFGEGTFAISSTISIPYSNVRLRGRGFGLLHHDVNPSYQFSTRLLWIGASKGTMVSIAPPTNISSGQHQSNNDFTGILLDANGVAGICLYFASVNSSHVNVAYREPTLAGVSIDTVALAEWNDPQFNEFRISGIALSTTGTGVILDGTATGGAWFGNTSFNQFRSVYLTILNGDGMVFNASDHNQVDFLGINRRPGGTGNGLVFNGSNVGGRQAYNNRLFTVSGGPIVARGTTSFTYPSSNNIIDDLDRNNGSPLPIVEPGASILWRDDSGVFGSITSPLINAANDAAAASAGVPLNGFYRTGNVVQIRLV